ncbi:MAG: TRAP transporter small permease subunit [Betaproteobacteria bacterium]|nr:TRAP transporter small permease subunit [Betaproteobacteria bacterium]
MKTLLKLSARIDGLNHRVGHLVMWLVLAAVLISAGNAVVRKAFGTSSNAMLEVQWYLFAAVFMLGAAYAFLENAHVRIDAISSRFSAKTRNIIDILGILIFLLPFCYLLLTLSWPLVVQAFQSGEMSQNAGGLIRWPVYAILPIGIALLALQSLSELVKRIAFLTGAGPDSLAHGGHSAEEEELAREIAEYEAMEQQKQEPR